MPNPLAMTASSGGATGATWRTAGRRDSETLILPLQLVAFSLSACMDRAIVCCLAQAEQTLKREHASTYALKHPLLEFSSTDWWRVKEAGWMNEEWGELSGDDLDMGKTEWN